MEGEEQWSKKEGFLGEHWESIPTVTWMPLIFGAHLQAKHPHRRFNDWFFEILIGSKLVLGGYMVWKVKTEGLGSTSCDPNLSWHHFVGISTRIDLWKKCFSRVRRWTMEKHFWKLSQDMHVKKLIKEKT